jgi:uncharacterized protein (TIGR00369 family)
MSLEEMLAKAGSYKKLLQTVRDQGLSVESEMQKILQKEAPLYHRAGISIAKIQDGTVQLDFPYNEEIGRVGKMVHGGIIMYVLDSAAGLAVMTRNHGIDQVTIELKVNFLEPLSKSKSPFHATGRVVRVGRTTAVGEAEIKDAEGTLCAKGLGTWYLIGPKN